MDTHLRVEQDTNNCPIYPYAYARAMLVRVHALISDTQTFIS